MAAPQNNSNYRSGRRFKSVIAERLEQRAVWDSIVDKAIDQAIEGDYKAREWLADRHDGKSTQSIEIDANVKTHEATLDELDRERTDDTQTPS